MRRSAFICFLLAAFALGLEAAQPDSGAEILLQAACERIPLERLFEMEAPVDRWVDAVPLGNGQAGALLWGSGDELRITLDRADYWHAERNPIMDDPDATWSRLPLYTNDMAKLRSKYCVRRNPCKLPGVRLVAHFADGVSCRRFVLNAREGSAEIIVATRAGERHLRAWFDDDSPFLSLSVPDGVEFASLGFTTNAAFAALGGYPEPKIDISPGGAFYQRGNRPDAKGRWVRDFRAGVRFVGADAAPDSAFWRRFWRVSEVELPDAVIQRFYDFAMYCYGAASRPPYAPIALQAVWTADNGTLPPWHGDYHMDLNVQESYWAAPVAGHVDALDAYAFHMTELLPAFQEYGRKFFGMKDGAAAIPGHMAYDGTFIAGGPMWALPPSHGLWGFAEVFNAWAYRPTAERLERIWPLGLALAKGVDQVLLPPDEEGVRRYVVSGSPEISSDGGIGESDVKSFLKPNTSYDRSVTKGFLLQVAALAKARGSHGEEKWLQNLAASLGPALLDEQRRYLVAPGMPLRRSHLHLSHLHDIFPFGNVDAGADALSSVRHYLSCGKSGWAGHTLPEAACKCASVGLGDEAIVCLREFASLFTARNGFHLNYWYRDAVRRDRPQCDVFTLEANLAFARGVQELLLQGAFGRIRLFPSLPGEWKGGRVRFRDLLAPGGHRVSATYEPGGRVYGEIVGFSKCDVEVAFPDGASRLLMLEPGKAARFDSSAPTIPSE